jgi:hypothetical protein
MHLPLFIVACPLIAAVAERLLPRVALFAGCLILLSGTCLALTENWTRPLEGPRSILSVPRDDQYFADMTQFGDRAPEYKAGARLVADSGCNLVGIDHRHFQLEYPFQRLVLNLRPGVRFVHTGVTNGSARYYEANVSPCAIFGLGCNGNEDRIREYSRTGPPAALGTSLLFLARAGAASN